MKYTRQLVAMLSAVVVIGAALYFLRSHRIGDNERAIAREKQATVSHGAELPDNGSAETSTNSQSDDAAFDYAAALNAALLESNPGKRSIEFSRLLREWLTKNPEAALQYVQSMHREGAEYTRGVLIVLEAVGMKDPQRAVRLAREMAATREQYAIYNILFDQFARTDIRSALSLLDNVPAGECREFALRSLATAWAESDLENVLQWAKKLTGSDKTIAMETALSVLSKGDPKRAIDLANQNLTAEALDRILSTALRNLTAADPESAAKIISGLPPGDVQSRAALDLVRVFANSDPEKALNWMKTLPAVLQQVALNNILDLWGKKDPAAAKDYVAQMAAGPEQDAAVRHLVDLLASRDPLDALKWVQSLGNESARNTALVSVASAWAKTDPAAATRWICTLDNENSAKGQGLSAALSYWVLQDPTAAANFVQSLPAADQSTAVAAIAQTYAQHNVAEALAWAQSLPFGDSRQLAFREILTRWTDNQPQDAARWVANEGDSLTQSEHVRTVLTEWYSRDAKAATAWVETLPNGASRDAALNVLATATTTENPVLAISWAQAINADDLRNTRLEHVAIAWLQMDRSAARNWITTSSLPADVKSRLLQL